MSFEPLKIIASSQESSLFWLLDEEYSTANSIFDEAVKKKPQTLSQKDITTLVPCTNGAEQPKTKYTLKLNTSSLTLLGSSHIMAPAYAPPPAASLSFCLHLCGNSSIPEKPRLPVCKTNTNMATYVHKRYMYQIYVDQYYDSSGANSSQEYPASRGVKHHYQSSLSRSHSYHLSFNSGNQSLVYSYSQIFDESL